MSHFHWFRSLRLLAVALAVVSYLAPRDSRGVYAQTRDSDRNGSHGEIPGGGLADQAQLQERLLQARLAAEFQDLVRRNHSDPRFLQNLQNDPKRQEEIERLLSSIMENHPGLAGQANRNDPMVRQLEGLYKDWGGKEGTRPPGFDYQLWKKMEKSAKAPNANGRPAPSAPQPPPAGNSPGADATRLAGTPGADATRVAKANPFATPQSHGIDERMMRWAQRFIEQNPGLRDSHIVRSVVEELDRMRLRDAFRMNDANTIGMQLARGVDKLMPSPQFIDEKLRPMLNRLPRPNIPEVQLPSVEWPRPSLPSVDWSSPRFAAPSGKTLGIVLLAVIAAATLLYLGLRIRRRAGVRDYLAPRDSRGPNYRLDLQAPIRNRRDLVRAFEQLSLQELGPEAHNWNHRVIAKQLGRHSVRCRRAADVLAQLYEAARYTPDSDVLPPDAVRIARREIELLAGASHA